MKKLSKRTLPIRVQVYAGLMLLCTVIVLTALSLVAAAWWVMHMPEGVLGAAAWAM